MRAFWKYLLACTLPFYLLPPLGKNIVFFAVALLLLMPVCCLLGGFFFTLRHRFLWYFPVLVGLLMLPTLWLFYNSSAWVYIPGFAGINLVGCLGGLVMRRLSKRETL